MSRPFTASGQYYTVQGNMLHIHVTDRMIVGTAKQYDVFTLPMEIVKRIRKDAASTAPGDITHVAGSCVTNVSSSATVASVVHVVHITESGKVTMYVPQGTYYVYINATIPMINK